MTYCPRTGKVSYDTRAEALNAKKRIRERTRRGKNKRRAWERDPYLCRYCNSWHLTSTTPA